MGIGRTYYRIVIPQALPASLPGMGNYLVGIFKDTPMLSTIGVAELMHTANALGAETYRYLEALLDGRLPVPDHLDSHGCVAEKVRGVGFPIPGCRQPGTLSRREAT